MQYKRQNPELLRSVLAVFQGDSTQCRIYLFASIREEVDSILQNRNMYINQSQSHQSSLEQHNTKKL